MGDRIGTKRLALQQERLLARTPVSEAGIDWYAIQHAVLAARHDIRADYRAGVAEWLIHLHGEVGDAMAVMRRTDGDARALANVLRVAAIAVACLEQHGIPREGSGTTPGVLLDLWAEEDRLARRIPDPDPFEA